MQQTFAQCEVLEVAQASHPAPFNPAVCDFVLQALSVAPVAEPMTSTQQADMGTGHGLWSWIKRHYQDATRM